MNTRLAYSRQNTGSNKELLSPEELTEQCGIIFITVTDSAVAEVWNGLRNSYDMRGKIICHCSGSLSSDIFSGADPDTVCSVHPMLAFNSAHTSNADISRAFFTLEGGARAIAEISDILTITGNKFRIINSSDKAKYHAAACFASNFVVAVCERAEALLTECGFCAEDAHAALSPLMKNNMDNIISCGARGALTGPASRGDSCTVARHLEALSGLDKRIYEVMTQAIYDMIGKDGSKA